MDGFNKIFHLTPEKQRQLALLKEEALCADKGIAHFYELDLCPVFGLYLTTGDMKTDGSNEKDVHMKFVNQPDYYPPVINSQDDVIKEAYSDYIFKKLSQYGKDQSKGVLIKRYFDYWVDYKAVIEVCDNSIREYHGVQCFEDGNTSNDDYRNVLFLHICNLFNIYVNKSQGTDTKVLLKSNLLKEIKPEITDFLFGKHLNVRNLETFKYQIDMFYMYYCYYCNKSFVPVSTYIDKQSDVFLKSKFFVNDNHFARHQKGKMMTINSVHPGTMARIAYRRV
jgi:hypothetical protein